mmetsp:Transcript_20815/g.45061  ORF Transcript_20815/g.45061 Transcript_20815/m.45061 type:complete len:443 (+) Transcript_20815:267-1595(+)
MTLLQPKYLVLILLVVQNTCLVLLMRYSRTRPGTMYLGSTAVCCDEAMKLVTCLLILTFTYYCKKKEEGSGGGEYSQLSMSEMNGKSMSGEESDYDDDAEDATNNDNVTTFERDDTSKTFLQYLQDELQFDFRMGGLALLYTVQKNLLYLAISNLDAAVFQVTYQAKILTTALFSVLLLGKKLSYQKIAGLLLLTLGVALVQLDKVEENASKSYQEQRRWVGVLAVLGACCTSGFGGVYFELVLKPRTLNQENGDTPPRPPPSVWAKNVQLSTFALVIALVTAFLKDHTAILRDGFFQGYSPLVVLVITLEAGGGLVVAAVIKYADNILKSFATAVSIVTSTIVSMLVFGFLISKLFIGGSLLVFVAIWMYSKSDESAGATQPASSRSGPLPSQTSEIVMTMNPGKRSDSGLSYTDDRDDLEMEDVVFDEEAESHRRPGIHS